MLVVLKTDKNTSDTFDLTSIWCHVFHKICYVNPTSVNSQRIEWHVTFLSQSTLKLYSPEFRWCVICVDPGLIILLNTFLNLVLGWCHIINVPLSRTVTFYSPIACPFGGNHSFRIRRQINLILKLWHVAKLTPSVVTIEKLMMINIINVNFSTYTVYMYCVYTVLAHN